MHALVTGASRRLGIGHAIAERLRADGMRVFTQGWTPHDAAQPWGADDLVPDIEADFSIRARPHASSRPPGTRSGRSTCSSSTMRASGAHLGPTVSEVAYAVSKGALAVATATRADGVAGSRSIASTQARPTRVGDSQTSIRCRGCLPAGGESRVTLRASSPGSAAARPAGSPASCSTARVAFGASARPKS
jgi:hypothetical protein